MTFPLFRYYIPGHAGFVDSKSSLWNTPLNGNKEDSNIDVSASFLIKDFFEYAEAFIRRNNYGVLKKGLGFYFVKDIQCSDIRYIDISLEKHGAFYHPAKISVELNKGDVVFFVLNTAVSDAGLSVIENEYNTMLKLNGQNQSACALIPKAFGMEKIYTEKGYAGFFLAEWFKDFHEFHITSSSSGSFRNNIGLWESNGDISIISSPDYLTIYEKASEILTEFYNPVTFEQVFPWHHAAGDFVIRKNEHGFDVRLITTRNYGALFGSDSGSKDNNFLLYGLLFFLLNLSLRMRIDRIDGTGEYFFISSDIIPYILKGFFSALARKELNGVSKGKLADIFFEFLIGLSSGELYELFIMMIDSYNSDAPDTILVHDNIEEHSAVLFQKISRYEN